MKNKLSEEEAILQAQLDIGCLCPCYDNPPCYFCERNIHRMIDDAGFERWIGCK
jgi:hypothetical protein